jgi:esterase/lipase
MITPIVESDTSSQINQVLQWLDKYNVKFSKHERVNEELQQTNEGFQKTNEDLKKMIAGLSTNVARVSYTSSFMPSLTCQTTLRSKHKFLMLLIAT